MVVSVIIDSLDHRKRLQLAGGIGGRARPRQKLMRSTWEVISVEAGVLIPHCTVELLWCDTQVLADTHYCRRRLERGAIHEKDAMYSPMLGSNFESSYCIPRS